jgi:hypothetical protein
LKRVGLALLLTLTLAAHAGAQEAAPAPAQSETGDPIGDILGALPPDQSTDEAEGPAPAPTPEAAVQAAPLVPGAQPAIPILTPVAPPPPSTAAARRPTLDRPVMIDESDRTPDNPPTALDLGYEARIKGSASNAQGLQGPLDGGWTVRGGDGAALYGLQLVDRGDYGPLEGAWRAMGGSGRVGLIDSVDRFGTVLTIRITPPGKRTAVLTLTASGGGGWSGEVADEAGARPVTMRRN